MAEHQEAFPPGRSKWWPKVAYCVLAISTVFALLTALALFWPYQDFSYGNTGPLKTSEYTSDGIPVIRQGGKVVWDQEFCNRYVTTFSTRWADLYAGQVEAGFADSAVEEGERVASFEVPSIIFYASQNTCDTTEVYAILPNYISPNAHYRLRVETSYDPNPVRTITSQSETELFLLLPEGAPIP